MTNLLEQSILRKYASIIINSRFPEAVHKNEKWNFRCNICKDSKKNLKKKRGWIEPSKKTGELVFKCYNCGKFYNLRTWLKLYFPEYHRMFLNEYLQNEVSPVKVELPVQKSKEKVSIKKDKFISLISEEENSLIKKAQDYVTDRKIPKDIWAKWFVCSEGTMVNRLIIPFYDKEDQIYFWQGRALNSKMQPKYLNCKQSRDQAIYNIDFIDRGKEVVIVEGVIDSLFIENCIATLSTNWSEEVQKILNLLNSYYLIDYDDSNETKKRVENLIKEGKKLFNWVNFIKDLGLPKKKKWDINDVYRYTNRTEKFTFDELKCYFTNNFYDSIFFKGGDF